MSGDLLRGSRKKQNVKTAIRVPTNVEPTEGYDEEFDPPPGHNFECPICLLILRDPIQTNCGHRFCKRCILKSIREGRPNCPVDNTALTENDLYPDNYVKREILNLRTRCRHYKTKGCQWIGTLSSIQDHLLVCDYEMMFCPLGCGESMERSSIDQHTSDFCQNRIVACEHCSKNVVFNQKEKHESVCLERKVPCPKGCSTTTLTRGDLENHSLVCPNEIVKCPFLLMGCTFQDKRAQLDAHLAAKLHNHLMVICQRVSESTNFNQSMKPTVANLNGQPSIVQKLAEIDSKMQEMERQVNGAHSTAKEALDLRDDSHKRMTNLEKQTAYALSQLSTRIEKQAEVVDDIRAQMWNGVFIWRITDMEELLRRAEHEPVSALHSKPFCSGQPGYKMCLRLNLGGVDSDSGSHIALFVHMMQGEHDHVLQWPFVGEFVIRIVDQTNSSSKQDIIERLVAKPGLQAFKRPTTQRNHKGYGYSEMIAHHVLRTNSYLKNGAMIIRVSVDVHENNKIKP